MPVIVVTRLRLRDPALLDESFTDAVAAIEQAVKVRRQPRRGRTRRREQCLVERQRLARTPTDAGLRRQ